MREKNYKSFREIAKRLQIKQIYLHLKIYKNLKMYKN